MQTVLRQSETDRDFASPGGGANELPRPRGAGSKHDTEAPRQRANPPLITDALIAHGQIESHLVEFRVALHHRPRS